MQGRISKRLLARDARPETTHLASLRIIESACKKAHDSRHAWLAPCRDRQHAPGREALKNDLILIHAEIRGVLSYPSNRRLNIVKRRRPTRTRQQTISQRNHGEPMRR